MTLSGLQARSHIASFFRCYFSYSCVAVDKISADVVHGAVPL